MRVVVAMAGFSGGVCLFLCLFFERAGFGLELLVQGEEKFTQENITPNPLPLLRRRHHWPVASKIPYAFQR
jgi:hypothetical protein